MRLLLLVFLTLFALHTETFAQHKPNAVEVQVDTNEVFIQGKVVKRLGVFSHVSIDNYEDIYMLPLVKQQVTIQGEFEGEWQDLAKAEIYRMKEDDLEVEIKLLEDIEGKANPYDASWSYENGTEVRLKWLEIY